MSERPKRYPLGEILDVASGQVDPTVEPYADMPHIGGENIESETGRVINVATANQIGLTSGKFLFSEEDVLYSKIRPNLNKVAVPSFVGICSADIYPLRPKPGRLSRGFLAHLLRSQDFHTYTQKHSSRTNIPKVNRESLLGYRAVLPPLVEQRRIAEVLDRAGALRAKRRAALAQLDSLTQSLFLDLFGDPVTNTKGWERILLGKMVERITKGESPGWQGFDYQNDGALFVTSENVRLGAIDLSDPKFIPLEFNRKLFRSELRPGDLLVNLVGASIGRSCIFPGHECPANINQAVAVVTVNSSRLENTFLSGLLTSERGQWLLLNNRVEGARANISLTDLRELNLPVPPIPLQRGSARRVTAVEALKTAQRASLAELDALFATLQHRAFRGEL